MLSRSLRLMAGAPLIAAFTALGSSGCYVEAAPPPPVYGDVYEPMFYDGYVVYYDDIGRPYYYANGVAVWVPADSPYYAGFVHHWHLYGPAYHRWYVHHGYRYWDYRVHRHR